MLYVPIVNLEGDLTKEFGCWYFSKAAETAGWIEVGDPVLCNTGNGEKLSLYGFNEVLAGVERTSRNYKGCGGHQMSVEPLQVG